MAYFSTISTLPTHSSNHLTSLCFPDNAAAQQLKSSSLNTLRGLDDLEAEAVEIFIWGSQTFDLRQAIHSRGCELSGSCAEYRLRQWSEFWRKIYKRQEWCRMREERMEKGLVLSHLEGNCAIPLSLSLLARRLQASHLGLWDKMWNILGTWTVLLFCNWQHTTVLSVYANVFIFAAFHIFTTPFSCSVVYNDDPWGSGTSYSLFNELDLFFLISKY